MINLRYHIVSITAVFLALGIGLAFGAAFIDRATVDALNNNLTAVENQNRDLEDANERLRDDVDDRQVVEEALVAEGLTQLLGGRLDGVPVLVLAAEGLDDDAVDRIAAAVGAAGASGAGVLRATERFSLDDNSELEDLREVLGLPDAPAGQLRTAAVRRLRSVLAAATAPDPGPGDDGTAPPDPIPGLVQGLLDGGFLDLEQTDPAASLVAEAGLRLVVVVGHDDPVVTDGVLVPLVRALATPLPTEPGLPPHPVVVAELGSDPPEDGEDPPTPYVSDLRGDRIVGPRLTTVDAAGTFAGLAAVVLGLDEAGEGRLGHYGTLDDAQRLLPAPAL